jgi:hypothetical protein
MPPAAQESHDPPPAALTATPAVSAHHSGCQTSTPAISAAAINRSVRMVRFMISISSGHA